MGINLNNYGGKNDDAGMNSIGEESQKRILMDAKEEAEKRVSKVAEKWAKMDLKGQVKVADKMARRAGFKQFTNGFLPGFKEDLMDKANEGATNQEIYDYYFGCPEFATFWKKTLGLTENKFRSMLPVEISNISEISGTTGTTETPELKGTGEKSASLISRVGSWWRGRKDQMVKHQVEAQSNQLKRTSKLLDAVIDKKIRSFEKKGVPMTMERLITGHEPLLKLGLTKEDICERIAERITVLGKTLEETD